MNTGTDTYALARGTFLNEFVHKRELYNSTANVSTHPLKPSYLFIALDNFAKVEKDTSRFLSTFQNQKVGSREVRNRQMITQLELDTCNAKHVVYQDTRADIRNYKI